MIPLEQIMQLPINESLRGKDAVLEDTDPFGYYDPATGMQWKCGRVNGVLHRCPDRQTGMPQP